MAVLAQVDAHAHAGRYQRRMAQQRWMAQQRG